MRQLLVALAWVDLPRRLLLQGTGLADFRAFLLGGRALGEIGTDGNGTAIFERSGMGSYVRFCEDSIDTWRRADEADHGFVEMPRTVRLGIAVLVNEVHRIEGFHVIENGRRQLVESWIILTYIRILLSHSPFCSVPGCFLARLYDIGRHG
jgi:hypothetical protein